MGRVRLTSQERRAQLLDAAAVVIVEHGLAALTMERLAATAGVSKALPYQHFDNADNLVGALRRREMAVIGERIATAVQVQQDGTFEEVVAAAIHAYFDLLVERGTLLAVLADAGRVRPNQPDIDTNARRYLADLFERTAGLDHETGEIAAAIVLSSLPAGVDAWVTRRASRRQVEAVLTLMIAGGVSLLAARRIGLQPANAPN